MKNIVFLLISLMYSCNTTSVKSKYYKISVESSTNFPKEKLINSKSIVRVDYLLDKVIVDIIKNDSLCSSKTFTIKNDTIMENWYSIDEYTYRLLFPELKMKMSKKNDMLNKTGILEVRDSQEWLISKQWGTGLTSSMSGTIKINKDNTSLITKSTINTPARLFNGRSKTIIKETSDVGILKFDQKWNDCR